MRGLVGNAKPSKNDIIMPKVIKNYVIAPTGPFISVGAVSFTIMKKY